jgi:hypothetical protein
MVIVSHQNLLQIALVAWEVRLLDYSLRAMDRIDGSSLVYIQWPFVVVVLQ